VVVEAAPPKVEVDVFEEEPAAPVAPPAPRTRVVKFIRATKEEDMQVDLGPELPPAETVTSTDPGEATDGK
jgi:hypothetical protein